MFAFDDCDAGKTIATGRDDDDKYKIYIPCPLPAATHVLVVPAPGLGVDGFSHRSQHFQRAQVVVGNNLGTKAHERSDCGGRGIELCHLVPLHYVPVPARREARWVNPVTMKHVTALLLCSRSIVCTGNRK